MVRSCVFVHGISFGDMNWLGALSPDAVVGGVVTA
jgi:hypothetical protein